MYYTNFFGMHFLWWMFWGFLWIGLLTVWIPVPRRRFQEMKETPVDILKRRLAKGEINEQQYTSLKARLENDERSEPVAPSARRVN